MRILLTGGKGFTGEHFAKLARSLGHTINILNSDLSETASLKSEVLSYSPTHVVHLAAISFVAHEHNEDFYRTNVIGTQNLLEAICELSETPQKVLIASSANIYGNCPQSPFSENQVPQPINHYAFSKLAMEYLAQTYGDRLPIVITRPFNYTGSGQSLQFLIPKLVNHFVRKCTQIELGNLGVEREFNDVRMVCGAYLKLLELGKLGEIYNICSGQTYAIKTVVALLEKISGYKIDIKINPSLIRQNEVIRLCGSPNKLINTIGPLNKISLEETLRWMINASKY